MCLKLLSNDDDGDDGDDGGDDDDDDDDDDDGDDDDGKRAGRTQQCSGIKPLLTIRTNGEEFEDGVLFLLLLILFIRNLMPVLVASSEVKQRGGRRR